MCEEIRATKVEQYDEALRRMEVLKIGEDIIESFKSGTLKVHCKFYNHDMSDFIVLCRDASEDEMKEVQKVEEEYGIKVFTLIYSNTNVGELLDCLYVTQYKEEWEMDDELMKDDLVMSYCINHTVPWFSEFGSIGIKKWNGALHRVQ